jgi:hypothetical protein
MRAVLICLVMAGCGSPAMETPDMTASNACDPKVSQTCPGTLLVCDAANSACVMPTACAMNSQCTPFKCGIMINGAMYCYQSCWASGAPQSSLCTASNTCDATGVCKP